jgi:citrate synthase
MISSPYRLGRPRQLYTGPVERDFIEIKNRKAEASPA